MYIYNLQENKLTFDNYYKKERCDASLNKLSCMNITECLPGRGCSRLEVEDTCMSRLDQG